MEKSDRIIIIIVLLLLESSLRTHFAFLPLILALTGWFAYKFKYRALPVVLILGIYESVGTGSVYFVFSYLVLALLIIFISNSFELEDFGIKGVTLIEVMYYLITYTLFVHTSISILDVIIEIVLVMVINKIFVLISRNDIG